MASTLDKHLRWFINDKFIFTIILVNSVVIYMQVSGYTYSILNILDLFCMVVFIVEMAIKLHMMGWKGYWRDGWNKLDGSLVILSLPSFIEFFLPSGGNSMSVLLAFRLLRSFRFFRFIHFFGETGMTQMVAGFTRAIKACRSVLAAFMVIILIFGLINCSIFKGVAPEFFSTPMESVYSVFRMFTVEGWYEIPDAVCSGVNPNWAGAVRLYFCMLLALGGIIGMSFINSIFVDAMAEDNNDDVKEKLEEMEKKLDEIMKRMEEK